jgi:hypothetical protein
MAINSSLVQLKAVAFCAPNKLMYFSLASLSNLVQLYVRLRISKSLPAEVSAHKLLLLGRLKPCSQILDYAEKEC